MEEMCPTLAVSYKQGKLIYDESVLPTCMDFNGYELVPNTNSLSSETKKCKLPLVPVANQNICCNPRVPRDKANLFVTVADCHEINKGNKFSSTVIANGNCLIATDENNDRSMHNNLISPTDELLGNMTCFNCLVDDSGGTPNQEYTALEVKSGRTSPGDEDNKIGVSQTLRKSYSCDLANELVNESGLVSDLVSIGMNSVVMGGEDYKRKLSPSLLETSHEIKISRTSVLCFDSVPLWGLTTIQGKRPEMEDSAIALPRFLKIPSQMLTDAPVSHALSQTLTAHLFGIYDGHGGSQPNREDECSRIEELGGKVINWDGHRVSGVLAVSRSIGDRYLRPYVIPDPEMMFVPRAKEDDCLILASDGLWDVLTNEEACDVARRRILLWHKKNGGTLTKERGENVDPAAQDAADYLTRLALQRGSRDNISVIVVDLKAQRKFKKKM